MTGVKTWTLTSRGVLGWALYADGLEITQYPASNDPAPYARSAASAVIADLAGHKVEGWDTHGLYSYIARLAPAEVVPVVTSLPEVAARTPSTATTNGN